MSANGARTRHDDEVPLPQSVTDQLRASLRGLKYGTVQITVHDGRVVQIERTERVRISNDP